jgi:hypothetical protein
MRRSIVWSLGSNEFIELVKVSNNYGEILAFFGLKNHGGNCKTLEKRIIELGADDSHIKNNIISQRKNLHLTQTIPLEDILVKNSTYQNRFRLKKRLIKYGLLNNICYSCGMQPLWNGLRLVLVLDHINGDNTDHRLENLRLLCPNCNSQTKTFCGRSRVRVYNCISCGCILQGDGKTGLCLSCIGGSGNLPPSKMKFNITKDELAKMVWETPVVNIAKLFSVSSTAIKKRCNYFNILTPSRGYWSKICRQRRINDTL